MSTNPTTLHDVQPDGYFTRGLAEADPAVFAGVRHELAREQNQIELIASENIVSKAVLEAQGSVFTNKYAEGYPGKRYYQGCHPSDEVEQLAIDRARQLFGCDFANVQPHSGAQANGAVMLALTRPGDTIMGLSLDSGGHLTHGAKAAMSGKWFNAVQYGVTPDTHLIDYDQVERLAKEHQPKLIITGGSAYPRHIDFARFRAIADEVGALFMVDMAHFAGLVAGGVHPTPFGHAHVVTTTTHKTLRGPRGGAVFTNDEAIAKKINSAVFPGLQGGPLMHVIAAKAVLSGKWYKAVQYGVRPDDHRIDFDQVEALAREHKPKLIITGGSAYPRHIDFARFRAIADEVGALFMVDMAHFAGLVAGGVHPTPFGHAHVVTTTTHKTLRGPRGGMIMTDDEAIAKKINSAVFPGLQGGPLMHVVAAKAVAFGEALRPEFKAYAAAVVENAKVLAARLKERGADLVSGGTDTHLALVDLRPIGVTGRDADEALERAGITCNKNGVPNDPLPPVKTSGIRVGSPAGTTRGFGPAEFREIADMIADVLDGLAKNGPEGNGQTEAHVKARVEALCDRFPIYPEL